MSSQECESGPSCLLGEVAQLITDEVKVSIERMIALANGQLTNDSVSHSPILPVSPSPSPPVRIYSKPPHQTSIEYIINRALGIPGADVDCYETTESCSERLQAAKDREAVVDYSPLLTSCDLMFKDALPMAIERLTELAAGITIQRMRAGKPYTITRRPNCRAIEFIADRVAGRTGSILGELQERLANPDTERDYTEEDVAAMSEVEKAYLKDAIERKESGKVQAKQPFKSEIALPEYVTAANRTLKNFLPVAIELMKILARGAQTIIETEIERKVFTHEPDARANTFLIDRFMGAPTNFIHIERIVEKTEHDKTMDRLTAKYPEVVARYGSIQAALKAHAERTR